MVALALQGVSSRGAGARTGGEACAEGGVIHYHGTPCTPITAGLALYTRRHAMVSFEEPRQLEAIAEVCQSFALDNGAFSAWKRNATVDWPGYLAWVEHWRRHPGCDFALIPDVIDGDEAENDALIAEWTAAGLRDTGVPVWHLHESMARLHALATTWPRVALGSSGIYSEPGSDAWWQRMGEAMDTVCDEQGRPPCKLHGLRMLNPTIFSQLPLASADSTAVARNIGLDAKWDRAAYAPRSKAVRALILADRIEHHGSAATWQRTFGTQMNMELIG